MVWVKWFMTQFYFLNNCIIRSHNQVWCTSCLEVLGTAISQNLKPINTLSLRTWHSMIVWMEDTQSMGLFVLKSSHRLLWPKSIKIHYRVTFPSHYGKFSGKVVENWKWKRESGGNGNEISTQVRSTVKQFPPLWPILSTNQQVGLSNCIYKFNPPFFGH